MPTRITNLAKPFLTLGIFAFVAVSFLALTHFGMSMDGEMDMSDCPFMTEMVICDMGVLDHLSSWQSIFSNVVIPEIIILALLFLAIIWVPYWTQFQPVSKDFLIQRLQPSAYTRSLIPTLFQYLFSKGILNPKLF